jgi:glycosyltransferase involved in cell wall biosynthesis
MRISVDATGLGKEKTGTAVYVTEILRCWNADPTLDHDFVILSSPKTACYLRNMGLDCRFSFVNAPDSRAVRILWQQLAIPMVLRKHRVDVHWGSGFVLPLLGARPMVVTIHDLSYQLFPAVHEPIKRYYFPAMIAAAVHRARRIITVSASTERDLHQLLPVSRGKTVVTLLAPRKLPEDTGKSFLSHGALPEKGYIMCIGTLEPRKNLARLLEAWLGIGETRRRGIKLVVVGSRGWMIDELLARYERADTSVAFSGFLEDEELNRLLQRALALAYPSLYEGFGLPVLEAMAQGVPVLTSDVGATREISGDAALLVDPTDVAAIQQGLLRLIEDVALRERLSRLGLVQADRFSWERTARQTLQIIEEAADG